MNFSLDKNLSILENTSQVLFALLNPLDEELTNANEGENTWTIQEVVAHLIICEESNWLIRAKIILSDTPDKTFVPIDMQAHFELAKNNTLVDLLHTFAQLRHNSLQELKTFQLQATDLAKTATHPVLGEVNLQQLISTWLTHDMSHIVQIARIIARQNKELVGKFQQYLKILG
jgi:uncharacterized damage-inducible protein DinB